VKSWIKELKRMLGNDVVLCIVENKIDLEKDRRVSKQTAQEYAQSVNAKLYSTSAKLNRGVEELFNDLSIRKYYYENQR
jgi:Ras-related protein Rab-21